MTAPAASTVCCWEMVSGEQWCSCFNAETETSLYQAENHPLCPGEIPSKFCILRFTYRSSKLTKYVGSSELLAGVKEEWLFWMCCRMRLQQSCASKCLGTHQAQLFAISAIQRPDSTFWPIPFFLKTFYFFEAMCALRKSVYYRPLRFLCNERKRFKFLSNPGSFRWFKVKTWRF